MDERTFPGPWSFDEIPQGYRVLDANRRVIAYVVVRVAARTSYIGK
jgi:hypothetical protein